MCDQIFSFTCGLQYTQILLEIKRVHRKHASSTAAIKWQHGDSMWGGGGGREGQSCLHSKLHIKVRTRPENDRFEGKRHFTGTGEGTWSIQCEGS